MEVTENTFAETVSKSVIHEYVEIDLTATNDCYVIPSTPRVARAIRTVFGEDENSNVNAPRWGNAGIWKTESPNLDLYRNFTELKEE